MNRRAQMRATVLFGLVLFGLFAHAQDVRIGVFGLFHPRRLALSARAGSALVVRVGGETIVLEGSSGVTSVNIRALGENISLEVGTRVLRGSAVTVASRQDGPADFNLAVPEKITRHYRGTLEVKSRSGVLTPVVAMELETAVGSVVAAEGTEGTPAEALKALAVAARSYLVAGKGRHHDFDFCDTTHCQFLREPPAKNSAVAQAVEATRDLVITYQSQTLAAMYTRSCSGRTRTPAELGLAGGLYPYYAVDCKYCLQHPSRWQSRVPAADAATLRSSDESSRLRIDRRLGWSAVPSDTFVMQTEGENLVLHGIGEGHGIGLCQAGAASMAREGADFREILAHYYPNASIAAFRRPSSLH